ncbi:MAG: hypothetical protein FJX67_11760 [Alphaproteobacteria bacterium]|nr:hypothetical protein [Alphaproteobacteria bacterium]
MRIAVPTITHAGALTLAGAVTLAGTLPAAAKIVSPREARAPLYELRCWQGAAPPLRIRDVRIVNLAGSTWHVRRDDGRSVYVDASESACRLEQQR